MVYFLHISATQVAIVSEMRYKCWIQRYVKKVFDQMHRCKILLVFYTCAL
jgi:hypothetical protein